MANVINSEPNTERQRHHSEIVAAVKRLEEVEDSAYGLYVRITERPEPAAEPVEKEGPPTLAMVLSCYCGKIADIAERIDSRLKAIEAELF